MDGTFWMLPLRVLVLGLLIHVEPLPVGGIPLRDPTWGTSASRNTRADEDGTLGKTLCSLMTFRRHFCGSQAMSG